MHNIIYIIDSFHTATPRDSTKMIHKREAMKIVNVEKYETEKSHMEFESFN